MALLIASDLHKDIAGEPLLRGVSFKLERRERMTIAGRNGAGKTTLLRMLAGETSIDRGELSIAKGVRIALHDQRPPRERDVALGDYVLSGCAEELQIEAELAELEAKMAAGETDEATLARYSKAQARLEARGGYLWRSRASTMAHGLGFRDEDLERRLDTFSGGQLTRASLARALATGADVLLLDEPTNHLDIESLEWLEQTLTDLDAAVVLVAHDRWFLEAVGTAVLELEAGRSRFFAGSWAQWRKEQAAREIALGKAIDKQQAEIERMERFIERFRYKATKARQAQSRVKKLDKIERIERDPKDGRALEFRFKAPERTGRVIFELERRPHRGRGRARRCSKTPSCGWSAASTCRSSGRTATGKTTLIETLAGRRELAAGKLSTGHNVKVGYLSQHADELGAGGDRDQSVLDAAQRATGLTPNKARALLGRFLFSGEEAENRSRGSPAASAAGCRWRSSCIPARQRADPRRAHEPSRHREPRGARGRAARVPRRGAAGLPRPRAARRGRHAHDRGRGRSPAQLRSAAGRSTCACARSASRVRQPRGSRHGRLRRARMRARRRRRMRRPRRGACAPPDAEIAARQGREEESPRARRRTALSDQQKAERAVEEAEAAIAALEEELADPAAWATRYEAAKSEARHTAARRAVEDAYARLEALVD